MVTMGTRLFFNVNTGWNSSGKRCDLGEKHLIRGDSQPAERVFHPFHRFPAFEQGSLLQLLQVPDEKPWVGFAPTAQRWICIFSSSRLRFSALPRLWAPPSRLLPQERSSRSTVNRSPPTK